MTAPTGWPVKIETRDATKRAIAIRKVTDPADGRTYIFVRGEGWFEPSHERPLTLTPVEPPERLLEGGPK